MGTELFELDAVEIADGVRRGELRAAEVLEHHLDRIERINPKINAFVFLHKDRPRTVANEIDPMAPSGPDPPPPPALPPATQEPHSARARPARMQSAPPSGVHPVERCWISSARTVPAPWSRSDWRAGPGRPPCC